MAVNLAPLAEPHLDAILEIQKGAAEAAQWSREGYISLLRSGAQGWIASFDGGVRGFLLTRTVAGEMEILNLAVDPACRRQRIGSALLRSAMDWAKQNGLRKVHLEVRSSNRAAIRFYEAHGFRRTGGRPSYYRDPVDDACLLSADVS